MLRRLRVRTCRSAFARDDQRSHQAAYLTTGAAKYLQRSHERDGRWYLFCNVAPDSN